jgi:hypothetical protein
MVKKLILNLIATSVFAAPPVQIHALATRVAEIYTGDEDMQARSVS